MRKEIIAGVTLILVLLGFLVFKSWPSEPPQVTLQTNRGDISLTLYPQKAPLAVENFLTLAKQGRYNGVPFHRVIEGFMIQGGDYENQDGTGGKSIWEEPFEDEISPELSHIRGALSMANRGPNTNGSQFFIVVRDALHLDGRHTIFGQVNGGMEVVDQMSESETDLGDRPLEPIIIQKIITD